MEGPGMTKTCGNCENFQEISSGGDGYCLSGLVIDCWTGKDQAVDPDTECADPDFFEGKHK